jgi:hypothetical protein
MARYQIRRVDGRWFEAEGVARDEGVGGWRAWSFEADVYEARDLPEHVPTTQKAGCPLAKRRGLEWVADGEVIARAVHVGG